MQTKFDFDGYSILIIDDNPANIGVIADHLEDFGFDVLVATDGEMGIKRARIAQPHLILLDIMMPDIDGFETCRRLKADDKTREIPIIFMTALTSLQDKMRGFKLGGVDYITKPVQHEEVVARVTTHLRIQDLARGLKEKNEEILSLNEQLRADNLRMRAELDVARKIQKMVLPTQEEVEASQYLDIACHMEPADEVGGDYYDVLGYDGSLKIGIGDVTGHGLESGVVMLMTQTAIRTLMTHGETDPKRFLNTLNRTLYDNMKRMKIDKSLTLSLLDYKEGRVRLCGQHEEMIVVRKGGKVERVDTLELGFLIGMLQDIDHLIGETDISLHPGDTIVLFSDGITEAENSKEELYGVEQLCDILSRNWDKSAKEIKDAVIEDVRRYIGKHTMYDDITLVVMKQR